MRITLLLSLVFLVPLNILAAQPLLKADPDQLNYSLGYHLGQQLQAANLSFDPDLLWQALNEGLTTTTAPQSRRDYKLGFALGQEISRHQLEFRPSALWQGLYDLIDQAEPRISEVRMSSLLTELRGQPEVAASVTQAPASKKIAPVPKAYRLPGQKFLAENESGKDIVSLPSGLQYRVLATGNGKTPKATDSVLVSYRGTSIKGKVFSSSAPMGINMPEEVAVSKVIPGWKQALQMMHEGDRWELYIPTRLAFKDSSPMAGQTVIYDLELIEVLPEFR